MLKQLLVTSLKEVLGKEFSQETLNRLIEIPKHETLGDLAFPCFELAKHYRKAPHVIAQEIACKLDHSKYERVEAVGGYVNVFLKKKTIAWETIKKVLLEKEAYGSKVHTEKKTMTIDLSSPNIAKPFSMGHLRSTVIGNSIALIAEKQGYDVVRINHLGDWGTQFGKLIVAYKKWGKKENVIKNPIKELFNLYVKFHMEAEEDASLNDHGREAFKQLESGNEDALFLWKWFRDESLKEFMKIYNQLGIRFDSYHGEAFYNDKMDAVVTMLEERGLLVESDGAQVVELENLPPCLITKRDGTTLYATRDLAAAIYRQQTYQFNKSVYVVGNEQSLHFKQLFAVLEKMGFEWRKGMAHVPFGMILKDGKKMSTRKGKVVLLEDVIKEAIQLALKNIEAKNPTLIDKEETAKQVGIGAIIFHDLKNYRLNDIEFSLADMLRFEGETGPYVQYTHARTSTLLKKGKFQIRDNQQLSFLDKEAWPIIKLLQNFPQVINQAMEEYDPSKIAKYLLDVSKAFNHYYATVKILNEEEGNRLAIVYSVKVVLKEGLRLLGIASPEEM